MFKLKHSLRDTANEGGDNGAGGETSTNINGVEQTPGPNDNWKADSNLDENGNPISNSGKAKNKTPPKEDKGDNSDKDQSKDLDTKDPSEESTDSKKPSDNKELDTESNDADSVDFNSPVVKQVEQLVLDAGLDSKAVVKAVTDNDGRVTPAILKSLVEKHGESVANLIANQLESFHKATISQAKKADNAIYSQVEQAFKGLTEQSGKESWKELSSWAKDNIPDGERREINKALRQGGKIAEYAVNDLVNQFKSKYSPNTQEAELMEGDGANTGGNFKPLTKQEYSRELRALEAKGHVYGQSQEMARLDQRRMKSIQRGI